MKRILSVLILTALLLSCVSFVSAENEDTEMVALVKDGVPVYTIVYTNLWMRTDDSARNRVLNGLAASTEDAIGTALPIKEAMDGIQDCEIYVGTTTRLVGDNQKQREAEGVDFAFDTELYGENGYVIRTCGSRYVIIGGSEEATKKAAGVFASEFRAEGTSTLLVPAVINRVYCGYCEKDTDVVLSVGDSDISEYAVVVSANAPKEILSTALDFRRVVLDLTGAELPFYRDNQDVEQKKILIGHTDLYDESGLGDNEYCIKVENGNLILTGASDYLAGCAADQFLRKDLGIINGKYKGTSSLKIPADLNRTAEPSFRLQKADCPDYPDYMQDNAGKLLGTSGVICYSDDTVADRLYEALNSDALQSGDEVFLISNRAEYCTCDKCQGKADAFLSVVNEVAKRFAPAGVTVSTLAYMETRRPSDIQMEGNVRVYFAEPNTCCAHALHDDSCEINKAVNDDLVAWTKACSDVYVLDFSQNYFNYPSTFPDLAVLQPNISYYKELGLNGVIMAWDTDTALLEFGQLRSILIDALLNDPAMSKDDYQKLYDDTMTELFHSYAPKIQEYIEKFEAASADHFTIFSEPSEILPIVKTEGKSGAEAYDLTLAKELGQIWEEVYYRHEAPEEPLIGPEMQQFYDDYIHSDYYNPLHARVQYSAWVDGSVPVCDRTAVYQAIIDSFSK